MELQIRHVKDTNNKYMFQVVNKNEMQWTEPVELPSPTEFRVEDHSSSMLSSGLRWYLEKYLNESYGAYPETANCIENTLKSWGMEIFDTLFTGRARDWYQEARRNNFKDLRIKIASDSPEIMAWPWEALHSRDDGYLAMKFCVERQLINVGESRVPSKDMARDAIHILYVISRPDDTQHINYHALAGNIVDHVSNSDLPVTVDVLRPPTFENLCKVLQDKPGYYHVVHFDGHGGYGDISDVPYGHSSVGCLVFETDNGESDPIETERLAQLLAEYEIPIMVLNACQSGMIDDEAQDQFACVAAGLIKAGVRNIVAMGYSLYVSGAKEFVPAFYKRLLEKRSVSEAVREGRKKMYRQPKRNSVTGQTPLQDWIVPVLYQQSDGSELFAEISNTKRSEKKLDLLPEEAKDLGDYGFIGRGDDVQRLERAMLRQKQAGILIYGQAGVGKTTLAKGFLHWLNNTGGLRNKAQWFNFQEIHSAEYVINELVSKIIGFDYTAMPMEDKLSKLVNTLKNEPFVLVWDNFESASGIEGTEIQPQLSDEDRKILEELLKKLRGGNTKVLITSRSNESWMSTQARYRLPMEGLDGEELWEYCNAVVGDLGLTLDRSNETYRKILEKLCGNPLAIRAVLLRLEDCRAERLLAELDIAFEGFEGDESTKRLQAAYKVFGDELVERYSPILQVTGLHEYYADTGMIDFMLKVAETPVDISEITECYRILENAGFCTREEDNLYRLHPALRGYLMRQIPAQENVQKGFVDVIGTLADQMTGMPVQLTGGTYKLNLANFYHANRLADELTMYVDFMALAQSLADYAYKNRRFSEAYTLYMEMAEKAKSSDDMEMEASAYHQLGMIAEEQREFSAAESWYKKSLEIDEKRGNDHGIAESYGQMGNLMLEQRDFEAAEVWYKKSLKISEKLGDKQTAAKTYHQLGMIAEEQRDFKAAEAWYKKSLEIEFKLGNEQGAAITYHQLGLSAEKQGDYTAAESWYKKSLEIEFKLGNEQGAAKTYHQLGIIAQEQRDFSAAESWYKKSLEISEKQGDEHGAALTYHQLGILSKKQGDFLKAAYFYLRAIKSFVQTNDPHSLMIAIRNYTILLHDAPDEERGKLREIWSENMSDEMTEILNIAEEVLNDAEE